MGNGPAQKMHFKCCPKGRGRAMSDSLRTFCRWLTVMAVGRGVFGFLKDLRRSGVAASGRNPRGCRRGVGREQLAGGAKPGSWQKGNQSPPPRAFPFESIRLKLRPAPGGRKAEAAELLGWGRNTLTRKLKDLNLPATEGPAPEMVGGSALRGRPATFPRANHPPASPPFGRLLPANRRDGTGRRSSPAQSPRGTPPLTTGSIAWAGVGENKIVGATFGEIPAAHPPRCRHEENTPLCCTSTKKAVCSSSFG
ncbi:MAG: hypothetical protein CM15mP25_0010 [Gammaproteobacteria bacterium]|nr:MAG: hypothetical protein CM15mP25_0010 [Gammaproteobacteria bacterium]